MARSRSLKKGRTVRRIRNWNGKNPTFLEVKIMGTCHLVKISGISGSAVNGTRFVGSSHWKIPRKSGKSKKVDPFSRLEFRNGMSCSIYVSRSLYQFQVHRRAQRRTGVYDQMEQLITNRKFHFCSHRNFRFFFPKWKAPHQSGAGPVILACNAGWSRRRHAFSPELYVLFSLFWGKLGFA